MSDPRLKQIKIKSGIVKRLSKEKVMYEKDAEKQKERVQKMKADAKDEYDIRKQEEVLQESIMMIPDCQKRLAAAYNDLKNILETDDDLLETDDYKLAKQILDEASVEINERK